MSIFLKKKVSFFTILKRKIVSTGIRAPDPWGEVSTAELFDLFMTEHKISIY